MDIETYLYACDECRHKAKKGEEYVVNAMNPTGMNQ